MGGNIDFDSLLIFEVESNPILYDRKLPENKCKKTKNTIWANISTILGKAALVCKKRWKHLRNTFVGHYKKNNDSTDSIDWIYIEPLKFLIPFIAQHTNNSSSETPPLVEDSDSPELEQFCLSSVALTLSTPSPAPSPSPPPPPPPSPTSTRLSLKRRNDLDMDELFDILNGMRNRKIKQFKQHENQ